jgi:hypothetical protein
VELPDSSLGGRRQFLMDRRSALPIHPDLPGNEPCQVYRQDLPQHVDAPYVNLGTTRGSPEREWASLRPLPRVGAEPP